MLDAGQDESARKDTPRVYDVQHSVEGSPA